MSDGEIDAGGPGGSEPQRRLSGGGADTAKGRSVERGDGGLRGSAGTKTGTSAGGRAPMRGPTIVNVDGSGGSGAKHAADDAGHDVRHGVDHGDREPDRERGA